jgi:DNA-binding CsgD family transcriptional regulator
MMQNWERIKQFDVLGYEAFSRMGNTLNAPLTDPAWRARVHPDVMAHINRFGMVHTLTTISAVPVLQLVSTISFYRADPERPFSDAERQLKQNLIPHLVETWNTNRLAFTHSPGNREIQLHRARAIFDKLGVLHNASRNFDVLMHAEWPDWQGPLLPPVLPDTLSDEGTHQYTGKNIVATSRALNDLFLLSIRKKSVVDDLSPRELGVAKLSGQGKDFREIAEELHLAPATVRNHLQAIYTKLGVNNKVEMARLILEAEV